MPVNWLFAEDLIRLGGVEGDGIPEADATRQMETARSILCSLEHQPGIVLSDEVGMGKTYVAMGVISSVLIATEGNPPVVVMTPPGLASKWQDEWRQFKANCVADSKVLGKFRDVFVKNPTEFFKAMGHGRTRAHLIWMNTRCFTRGLQDPWVKLALCRIARGTTKLSETSKKRFDKWAEVLVRMKSRQSVTKEMIRRLMHMPLDRWHDWLISKGIIKNGEPPLVPRQLVRDANGISCKSLKAVLRDGTIPGHKGAVSDDRLRDARRDFKDACQEAYENWIRKAKWGASLLVLDEAHHAKNDATWLARMFRPRHLADVESLVLGRDNDRARPIFWNKFDRLLFLTATPFQLGHDELIRVLRSFAAAKWSGQAAPDGDRQSFLEKLNTLNTRLDENRKRGRRLDDLWSRIGHDRVARHAPEGTDIATAAEAWWKAVAAGRRDPFDVEVFEAVEQFRKTKDIVQKDVLEPWTSLRTWVIRHNRPMNLLPAGDEILPRRIGRHGRAILDQEEQDAEGGVGLDLGAEDPLPFLLAVRAQGELAGSPGCGRAYFAEGLASSYEAFRHTRDNRGADVRDTKDHEEKPADPHAIESIVPVEWYESQVESSLSKASGHPKLAATVRRTAELWENGEKVLLFCTYRQTAQALRDHIRDAIENSILRLAGEKAGLELHGRTAAKQALQRMARRLSNADGDLHKEVLRFLDSILDESEFRDLSEFRGRLVNLLVGYIRSHSFIARYLPRQFFRAEPTTFAEAIDDTPDLSGTTLRDRIREFLRFALEEAARGQASDPPENRLADYLNAVAVAIRPRRAERVEDGGGERTVGFRAMQVVRMVIGRGDIAVRDHVMSAFNSPMFPEVLVSSSVLGEGVDLHRFCRFVIHHDLSWNPSVIEQRTGRIDRIRCRAETVRRPIVVYQPYIAESADEKLYRVLRDRERWFQVVMGQRYSFDERTSEKIADRVPLPKSLAETLLFDLRRYCQKRSATTPNADSPETTTCEETSNGQGDGQSMSDDKDDGKEHTTLPDVD
jgi:superfamily II DNA or RNA helicase